ncbi:MAG: zinc metalloprotease HtpX [Selenomonadaceae bacterium]|nr:zinc metalloprotease HtpX [Selenomonadaceae bacterium]
MNTLKTTMLMALLTGIMVAAGGALGGHSMAFVMLIVSIGMNLFGYWFSDSIVLKSYGAREVSESEAPELYHLVEKLADKAQLPMPKVCIIDSNVPNAFATGRSPSHAAVAVTTGIMRALNYNELSGVLAHEISHVKHRDTLISTIAACMAGVISMIAQIAQFAAIFGGRSDDEEGSNPIATLVTIIVAPIAAMLIQMAISRSREYEADKSGGEICGNPNYLADALEKIEYYATHAAPMQQATQATSHLFIVNPLSGAGKTLQSLFSTHPATSERIALLRQQASEMRLLR